MTSHTFGMPAKLKADIDALSNLSADLYSEQINNFRSSIVSNLKFEREECQSKYRPQRGTPFKKRKELGIEKDKCLNLVKEWSKDYFKALAVAKKRYISKIHSKELEEIDSVFTEKSSEN